MKYTVLFLYFVFAQTLLALPDTPTPKAITAPVAHAPYWNRETKIVFSAEVAAAAADTTLTCRNLSAGGREINLPIRTCAQMVGFQIGIHGAAQGVAWILWKTGHPHLAQIPRLYLTESNVQGFIFSARH